MSNLRRQFERMMMVIIDEMSLVAADMFYTVHKRLVEILYLKDMFADRGVMLVGDLMQIPPVQQQQHSMFIIAYFFIDIYFHKSDLFFSAIFMEPSKPENKALYNSDMNLWDSCQVVNLKQNFRVGESPWNETLNRIRFGEQTEEDIKLLKSRYVSNFKRENWDNAIHAFYTNEDVKNHNIKMLNKLKGNLITLTAYHQKGIAKNITNHGTINQTQFEEKLELKKGAKVMMVHNVDIADGLVNGVTGTAINFSFITVNGKKQVQAVIVKFDDDEIGKQCRKEHSNFHPDVKNRNGVPIFKTKFAYQSQKQRSQRKTGKDQWLQQYPLKLAYASTGNNLQYLMKFKKFLYSKYVLTRNDYFSFFQVTSYRAGLYRPRK